MDSWIDGFAVIRYSALLLVLFIFLVGVVVANVLARFFISKHIRKYGLAVHVIFSLVVSILGGLLALELSARILGGESLFFF